MNKRIYINDIILIILITVVLVVLCFFIYGKKSESNYVEVRWDNNNKTVLDLEKDTTFNVPSKSVTVTVKDGKAYISKSDCPDGLCKNYPAITKNSPDGSSAVCLPNKISIVKIGGLSKEADAVAG